MKVHVSAFIDHRQFSTLIKKSLYKLYEVVLMLSLYRFFLMSKPDDGQ
jgi:hypothetical protein